MTTNTAGAIIQAAFEDSAQLSVGGTCSTAQNNRGLARLNDIINLWATQGLKLWLQQVISVPLVAGQTNYSLGPTGSVVMTKPLSILQATYITVDGVRQPLNVLSRDEYTRLPQTNIDGAINSYFTDKALSQLVVSFWNSPDATAATGTCELLARVSSPNVSLTGDSTSFPPEWAIALRWALADELATGQSDSIQNRCAQRSEAYRTALEAFDVEDAPTFFQPDQRTAYNYGGFR